MPKQRRGMPVDFSTTNKREGGRHCYPRDSPPSTATLCKRFKWQVVLAAVLFFVRLSVDSTKAKFGTRATSSKITMPPWLVISFKGSCFFRTKLDGCASDFCIDCLRQYTGLQFSPRRFFFVLLVLLFRYMFSAIAFEIFFEVYS